MSPIKVEWVSEDSKPKSTNFRRMLLTKCQQEFEKDKKDDETLEKMKEEIEKAETVRFVAEGKNGCGILGVKLKVGVVWVVGLRIE